MVVGTFCCGHAAVLNVTFDALQVENDVMAQQNDDQSMLLDILIEESAATKDETRTLDRPVSTADGVSLKGQFTIRSDGMDIPLRGINMDASELNAELHEREGRGKAKCSQSLAILHRDPLNDLCPVLVAWRQTAVRAVDTTPVGLRILPHHAYL